MGQLEKFVMMVGSVKSRFRVVNAIIAAETVEMKMRELSDNLEAWMKGVASVTQNRKIEWLFGVMLDIANEMSPRRLLSVDLDSVTKAFMTPSKFTPQ